MLAPVFNHHLCFHQRIENLAIEQFIAHSSIERIPQAEHLQGVEIAADRELRVSGFRIDAQKLGHLDQHLFVDGGGEIFIHIACAANQAQAVGNRPGELDKSGGLFGLVGRVRVTQVRCRWDQDGRQSFAVQRSDRVDLRVLVLQASCEFKRAVVVRNETELLAE